MPKSKPSFVNVDDRSDVPTSSPQTFGSKNVNLRLLRTAYERSSDLHRMVTESGLTTLFLRADDAAPFEHLTEASFALRQLLTGAIASLAITEDPNNPIVLAIQQRIAETVTQVRTLVKDSMLAQTARDPELGEMWCELQEQVGLLEDATMACEMESMAYLALPTVIDDEASDSSPYGHFVRWIANDEWDVDDPF